MAENKELAFFLARRKEALADEPAAEPEDKAEAPDELIVAATDIQQALHESPRALAKALHAFFTICESMPHAEGGE